eukprot:scaffold34097_cov148-Skeletonema_menzelii.AAC.2
MKLRYVEIENQPNLALRYENDGNSYIVNGPVPTDLLGEPINLDEEKTFSVPCADIAFQSIRTPVMLHRLTKAAHLNGEVGDIRDFCKLSNRSVVHLEGKGLKPSKSKKRIYVLCLIYPIQRKNLLD